MQRADVLTKAAFMARSLVFMDQTLADRFVNNRNGFPVSGLGSFRITGGDCFTGPATLIGAVGAGNRAAIAIDKFLRGEAVEPTDEQLMARYVQDDDRHAFEQLFARLVQAHGRPGDAAVGASAAAEIAMQQSGRFADVVDVNRLPGHVLDRAVVGQRMVHESKVFRRL